MRLNKYIAYKNIASRREADNLIKNGYVKINGVKEINPAIQVQENDFVIVEKEKKNISIKLYKPKGYVVSTNEEEGIPVYSLIKESIKEKLYPIGRLDKDSTGLILFTNDGVLSKKILSPDLNCEKEYYVKVNNKISDVSLKKLEYGIKLDEYKLKKCIVKRVNKDSFYITLTEGKNRQIRRMCSKVGLKVLVLKRIRIAGIYLDDLKIGEWMYLTEKEVSSVK